jgi:NADPH-dependent 2,4-dienoyl-CoA reductase/sulfur reductase-like enzyme
MAAAMEASARGCRVTVLDEGRFPGGQIYRQADPDLTGKDFAEPSELRRKYAVLERFASAGDGFVYRPGCAVYAVFSNREVHFADGDHTEVMRPDAVILATGVREVTVPFPGWTMPGVMFAGGAQSILKSQRVLPGRKAVIAGCGPLPIVVAAQLLRAGGDVAALASLHPPTVMLRELSALWHGRDIVVEGIKYAASVLRAGVLRLTGHVPVRALGKTAVEAVVLARADEAGNIVAGTEHEIECDLLAVNYGFAANSELAAMAGAPMRRDAVTGWVPIADAYGRTGVPGIFVAGDSAGLRGALIAESEGTIVGAAASEAADGEPGATPQLAQVLRRRARYQKFQPAVRESLRVPLGLWKIATPDTVVCRCENVRVCEIMGAIEEGHGSLNAIKRNIRAGMGWCGGRTCLPSVAALAELHSAPAEMMTPRPLARPVPFAALARQQRVEAP